jgi:hypothetical protein
MFIFWLLIRRISAELDFFNRLQNLFSGPSPPDLVHDVILLEEDATALLNELKVNSALPESSRRPVKHVKQEFFKHLLEEQSRRRSYRAEATSSTKYLPAMVSILDVTSIRALGRSPFLDIPYIVIRDEYLKMVDILKSKRQGDWGSVFLTGQPGIGSSL